MFVGNSALQAADGGGAGAARLRGTVSIHISDSVFADNLSVDGSGVLQAGTVPTLIDRTTFARNRANDSVGAASTSTGTIINCTFSENTTNISIGALSLGASSTVLNCTFTGTASMPTGTAPGPAAARSLSVRPA